MSLTEIQQQHDHDEDVDLDKQQPRKSSRSRKQIDRFEPNSGQVLRKNNKKRAREDEDEEEEQEEDRVTESDDDEDDPSARQKKHKTKTANESRATKSKKTASIPRPPISPANGDETGPKTDSAYFTAMLSTEIALQPLVEEWVETYQNASGDETSERSAVYELVLFFIRCCGLTSDIEEDEAMDADGVLDVLERLQDQSVKTSTAIYPLTSKAKEFKSFRTNLDAFLSHLITTLSLSSDLYHTTASTSHSTPLLPLLMVWLHSMSSSPLRPIRHTSTYIALKINSALCEVAQGVTNDLGTKQRQREAEIKKGGSSAAAQKRIREAEKKVEEEHERKFRLQEYMLETMDAMFVHRIRDADPSIRADCMRELGVWMRRYPSYYHPSPRLETVKALSKLYAKNSFVTSAQSVTLRLIPRLVEMSLRDIDLSVRIHSLTTLTLIDKTGLLRDENEEERGRIAKLIWDNESRIRRGVGGFVAGLWVEKKESLINEIDGLRGARKKRATAVGEDEMSERIGWRSLVKLLVEIADSLDSDEDDSQRSKGIVSLDASSVLEPSSLASLTTTSKGDHELTRALAAVEALWDHVDILHQWESLLNYCLLDHSGHAQDIWLMSDDEEDFMLKMLVVILRREEKDDDMDERTKTLIRVLPRLFSKHQGDSTKMMEILSIPRAMNLGLYLDLRMNDAYTNLWADLIKQFTIHTSPDLLQTTITTIQSLLSTTSLEIINQTKFSELTESLITSLSLTIGEGEDVATINLDDERQGLIEVALLRIALLSKARDVSGTLEDVGEGSNGWEIVCAFAERGKLGFKEEAKIVEYAIQVVFLHMTWLFKNYSGFGSDDQDKTRLIERQSRALAVFQSNGLNPNNALENVKRQGFISFINLHILFHDRPTPPPAVRDCSLVLAGAEQYKLSGAFQASLERYATEREARPLVTDDETSGRDDRVAINRDLLFLQIVSVYVAAIRCGVLDVEHAKLPLSHYGRFGMGYDAVCKKLVDVLKDEGIYNRESDTVQHVVADALQDSFTAFLDSEEPDPISTVSLAKLVASSFQIQGNHFSIIKQINSQDIYDLHESSITWLTEKILSPLIRSEKAAKTKEIKARIQSRRLRALTYFKVLVHLLSPLTGSQCLKVKRHLEEKIEDTGAPPTGSDAWTGYRAYEKKLVSIASRDGGVVGVAKRKVAAAAEEVVGGLNAREDEGARRHQTNGEGSRKKMKGMGNGKRIVSASQVDDEDEAEEDGQLDGGGNPPDSGHIVVDEEEQDDERNADEAEDEAAVEEEEEEEEQRGSNLDLDVEMHQDGEGELDIDSDVDIPEEMRTRERSESIQPVVGRKRTIKRF